MPTADAAKPDPVRAYAARLEERHAARRRLEQQDVRLSTVRGVLGAIGVGALVALGWIPWAAVVLVLTVLVFVAMVVAHDRVARRLARVRRRIAFLEDALARTRGDVRGRGEPGERFLDPAHPYAADLDLFGPDGLFPRLCAARTRSGQERLAAWLTAAASPAEVRERQRAVSELGPRLDLREDLAVLGSEARGAVDSATLLAWAAAEPVPLPRVLRTFALVASVAAAVVLAGMGLDWWGRAPLYLACGALALCRRGGRAFSERVLERIGRPSRDLQTLRALLDRLAGERFASERLARLGSLLSSGGETPGVPIARLTRWLEVHDSKGNVFFAILAFFLVWDLQLAWAVERWRRRHGTAIVRWLDTLAELEALVSLGAYAFENPDDPFPLIVDEAPLFDAQGLAHPLLPGGRAVRNDLRLDAGRQMLVVTGSNMSGKSTLLRAAGLNTALALCGAPVRAAALTLSPLAVGASIRVQDSLADGASRFYAEIKRIRQVLDVAQGDVPALFLLDEIFDGTNSAERRTGAEAVVRALLERRAIGLTTSHDLALAEIARSLAPRADNVHFEDHLEEGRIAFDYRLKPGPVERGNALGLMRAVGLIV